MAGESGGMTAAWRRGDLEILGVLVVATAVLLAAPLNSDSAYGLAAARRLLGGERLYVDLIETNPPLVFWLMSIPAVVGDFVALPDARVIAGFMGAALWTSAGLAALVFSRTPDSSRLLRSAVVGSYVASVVLMAISQVGQREQLTAILVFPYVVLAARAAGGRSSPVGMGVACGVLAGLGIAIKPFFVAPWVAMEIAVLVMQGRRALVRPEVGAVALVQVVFAAAVLAVTMEYVTTIVPLVSDWYRAYEMDRLTLMTSRRVLVLAVVGIAAIVVPGREPTGMAAACARLFGAATLAWIVVFVGQGKGWLYQLLPGQVSAAAALAAAGVVSWGAVKGWRLPRSAQWLAAGLVAALVTLAGVQLAPSVTGLTREARALFEPTKYPDWFVDMLGTVERRAPGQPVYVMSTSLWPAFPIVNLARVPWRYHYHFLWPIPSLYGGPAGAPYRIPERQGPREREFFDTVVADLVQTPPRLLFVERGAALQAMAGRSFDFVEYFSGSQEFRTLFQRYRRLSDIGKWEVYERVDAF